MIRLAPRYAELATTTNFSFLRGASHPEELVARAGELGLAGIGDRRPQHARRRRARACLRAREPRRARRACASSRGRGSPSSTARPMSSSIRKDRAAYGRLSRLLSAGNLRAPKGECHLRFDELLESAEGLQAIAMPFSPCGRRGARSRRMRGRAVRRIAASGATPHPLPLSRKGRGENGGASPNCARRSPAGCGSAPARPTARTCAAGWRQRAALARKLGAPLIAVNDVAHARSRAAAARRRASPASARRRRSRPPDC